nr:MULTISPECIES: hypothetical protein [unclassified Streptomyces]
MTEGLLPPSRSSVVRRHLDGCALCADVRSSLEEIRGLLGTLPGPPRMPAEIAGRIDAALAAEALLSATTPGDAAPGEAAPGDATPSPSTGTSTSTSTSTSTPAEALSGDDDARESENPPGNDDAVSRETAPTPAKTSPSAPSSPSAGRPAGRSGGATGPGRGRRSRRRRVALLSALGTAFGALVIGTSLYISGPTDGDATAADTMASQTAAGAVLSRFSGAPVEDRVRALLHQDDTRAAPRVVGPESMSGDTSGAAPQNEKGAVPGCVLAGTGRTDPVLGRERGEYRGTPAYLLVLSDPTDGDRVQAYVLDASCTDGPGGGAGSPAAPVLFSETYPRS